MIGQRAKAVVSEMCKLPSVKKNKALLAIAQGLLDDEKEILAANKLDFRCRKRKKYGRGFS